MSRPGCPPRRNALQRYVTAVSVTGGASLLALAAMGGRDLLAVADAWLAAFAVAVVLGECLRVRISAAGGEFTTSTTFSLALLWTHGIVATIVVQAIASVIADLISRKPLERVVFNVGQLTLSWMAAGGLLILLAAGHTATISHADASDLVLLGVAGACFVGINFVLASTAPALAEQVPILSLMREQLRLEAVASTILVGFCPVVIIVATSDLRFFPLLGLPLMAVYLGGQQAVRSEHQALHDALTGLPNRVLFRRSVTQALTDNGSGSVAILVMDLDRFKDVNDTLGHAHGDLLLREIGPRVAGLLREKDMLARLGGDEFAVLLRDLPDPAVAVSVAERIVEAMHEPVLIDGLSIEIGTSIGIACAPRDGDDVETLVKRADTAMYHAKERGVGIATYDGAMDEGGSERLLLVAELRRAIEQGELELHYQPKLDLRTGEVHSAEALVRWRHPVRGMLPPGVFIPLAEHTGLIRPMTDRVLDLAVAQIARWRDAGRDLRVAVNVSARSLLEDRFAEDVRNVLEVYGVPARYLELEITESTVMADADRARRILGELRDLGVTTALDDFGTGYSSLAYLKRLPVDTLKIDRSLVADLRDDPSDRAIVASMVSLSTHFALEVVAEGVEDQDTLDELALLGCQIAQGYFISRPMPAEAFEAWLVDRPAIGPRRPPASPRLALVS